MKILCWNVNEDVWNHWNQVIDSNTALIRPEKFDDIYQALENSFSDFKYCFIYIEDEAFSESVEAVVDLQKLFPQQKIIVFFNKPSQQAALRLFSVGISGQCSPYIGQDQLSLVLTVVDSGEIWGGKAFIQQLIAQSANIAPVYNDLDCLSEREQNVAEKIAEGLSNKKIASEMDITERTVKAHLTSIFKKTNTKDRLSLALLMKKS